MTEKQQELVDAYRSLVVGRKAEADQGYERAIAALREAMNLGPGLPDRARRPAAAGRATRCRTRIRSFSWPSSAAAR